MTQNEITVLTDVSLITCIVQRGQGDRVVEAAQAAGAQGATVHYARGTGVGERLGVLGVALEVDKETVNIVVANDQIDLVFERVYGAAELDTPGRGFMYVTPLEKAATFIPADVLARLEARGLVRERTGG